MVKTSTSSSAIHGQKPANLKPGQRWTASYAVDPEKSRGRLLDEPESPTRSPFQRDRDRIVHSTAFRRLKHKTQVFIEHEGDHYRTRLTHTLEVAQIARSIARALGLDEDLAETLALAHDLGHTPFGHAGERALDRALSGFGGFDHNAQSLKIVTSLERRYARFDGLNLTWETLEGLVKHNGPLVDRDGRAVGPHADKPLPAVIAAYDTHHSLELWSQASMEAQAAAIADDIAYNAHDIDDGLRAGIITLEALEEVPFLAGLLGDIRTAYPGLGRSRTTHELQRRIITLLVEDVISESERRLQEFGIETAEDVRKAPKAMIGFSDETRKAERTVRDFLFKGLYRNSRIMTVMADAERMVEEMHSAFTRNPALLPEQWRSHILSMNDHEKAVHIGDFIAGMTDRYAIETHRQLQEKEV
ncbi:MAG: deoxyguanosinetriphosphate triphosphohydrolase [Beijerinckiaceae bacterium]